MAEQPIRVGLIGAGGNVRNRHIPGFQGVDDCEIVAVANRTVQSGRVVADQFNIPKVYSHWREVLEDDEVNAVCIGTWPYMHRTLTMASLESGKHVLCEARMAMNAGEAHEMLAASQASPNLVAQIVPSPMTFGIDDLMIRLISDGFLGDLVSMDVQSQTGFADLDSTLHWRQDRDMSGFNILNMGIWYEAMIRWVGRATQVMAMSQITVPHRRDDDGNWRSVTVPDTVDILCRLANGANAHLKFSACAGLSPGNSVWLHGTEGTIHVDNQMRVYGGKRGAPELQEIANPPEARYSWSVEQEFIASIRDGAPVMRTPFNIGVHYMEWTEAVTASAQRGESVHLPL
jgi:predicted dehydrogenase